MARLDTIKQYNITERRTANYVSPDAVSHMEKRIVFKVVESCVGTRGLFQSTHSSIYKLEYKMNCITHALSGDKLLSCFDFIEGAETYMRSLHKKTDRLFLIMGWGYTDGSWDVHPDDKRRGWLNIRVKAIMPIFTVENYDNCMKGGESND